MFYIRCLCRSDVFVCRWRTSSCPPVIRSLGVDGNTGPVQIRKHRRGLVCSTVNNALSRGNTVLFHFSESPTFRLGSGGLHHINHTCGFKVTLFTVIYPAYPRTFPPALGNGKTPSAGRQQNAFTFTVIQIKHSRTWTRPATSSHACPHTFGHVARL